MAAQAPVQGNPATYAQTLALAHAGTLTQAQFNYWMQNDTPVTSAEYDEIVSVLSHTGESKESWVQGLQSDESGTPTDPLQSGSAAADAGGAAADSVPNPFAALFQASIWLRVAEVVAGLILLGIGLNSMLKGKPLQVVTSAAGGVGKAAMLA